MANATLLPASLQKALQEILERTNLSGASIRAVLLSTTEGVPLGRVYASDEPLHEEVLASIESVWAPPSKQIPVLGKGKVKQVMAIYDHGTLIHVYQTPVVVTILCGPQSNLGAVRVAIPSLEQVLQPLCKTLMESLNPPDETHPEAYDQ